MIDYCFQDNHWKSLQSVQCINVILTAVVRLFCEKLNNTGCPQMFSTSLIDTNAVIINIYDNFNLYNLKMN